MRHAAPVRPPQTAAALADLARLGPFFAIGTDPAERAQTAWRPLSQLYSDPRPLRRRIAEVHRILGTDSERVAASLTFQGLSARVVAPSVALAALHGVLAPLDPDTLYWRPAEPGPWPLWTDAGGSSWPAAPADELAARLAELVIERHLRQLVEAVRAQVRVARPLLWGNAASSVAAALRLVGEQRPLAAPAAGRLADALLSVGPLAGTWSRRPTGEFRRRTCCLYYRTPDGGLCGDCVFDEPPAR